MTEREYNRWRQRVWYLPQAIEKAEKKLAALREEAKQEGLLDAS